MMFSLRFAVLVLFLWGVSGQQNDNPNPSDNVEKGYPFGRLRLSEDGKKDELISGNANEKTQFVQDQAPNVTPLPSPCTSARPLTKLAYPGDKSKYIHCRDEFHYEIFSCPNGGEFNEQRADCDAVTPVLDRCAEEKPCLNDGQCTVLSNSSFKCTCRPDWTGDRCDTPINSCVRKPCGPDAECRILKTNDYDQDYVCVCPSRRGYGLSCQEVVPNPCLKGTDQFFPYAFSQHAYIQCDGDIAYFQPCGPLLYWNQEEKVCDRKRPPKLDLSTLIKKYGADNDEDSTTTTVSTTERPVKEEEIGANFRFIPAKVPNRQQGLFAQSQQRTQVTQNQPTQSGGFNQSPQNSQSRSNQWSNTYQSDKDTTTTTTTTQATVTLPNSQGRNFQSWQTQPTNQWTGNQGVQTQPTNQWTGNQGVQTQPTNQWTGNQGVQTQPTNQWTGNQGVQTQPTNQWTGNQGVQTQPTNQWTGNQGVQTQPWQNFQGAGVPQPVFTTTPSPVNVPSWQHQPNNQWPNNQGVQTQPWQNVPGIGGQQPLFTTTPSPVNVPSWQPQPSNQWPNNQGVQTQPWQNVQGVGGQQPLFTTTLSPINTQPWQSQWNNNQGAPSQSWQNVQGVGGPQPAFPTTPSPINTQPWQNPWGNNQGVQPQPWSNSRSIGSQRPTLPTTTPSTVNASSSPEQSINQAAQSFQQEAQFELETMTPSNAAPAPNQSWQTKSSNQRNTNPNSLTIGFQPQQTSNTRPLTQSWQNGQTVSTQQPIPPLRTTTTPQTNVLPNNQWNNNGVTQQRGVLANQKSFDRMPSWSQNNINTQSMTDQQQTSDSGSWNNNRA